MTYLEPIEEELVPDELVEVVWDPQEGQLHPLFEPQEPEYELRDVNGVSTPFFSQEVMALRDFDYSIFAEFGTRERKRWFAWGRK